MFLLNGAITSGIICAGAWHRLCQKPLPRVSDWLQSLLQALRVVEILAGKGLTTHLDLAQEGRAQHCYRRLGRSQVVPGQGKAQRRTEQQLKQRRRWPRGLQLDKVNYVITVALGLETAESFA